MRRNRRQREENPIIEAIKWWQDQCFKVMLFIGLPASLLYVGFAWWIGTPAGQEFMGFAENDRQAEKRLESLDENAEKRYNEFTESTNEDAQNTIDDIQGTQEPTGTEQYSEEVQNTINELDGTQ